MTTSATTDQRFLSLPFPLRHPGPITSLQPVDFLSDSRGIFGRGQHRNQQCIDRPQVDAALIQIGEVPLLAARSTPCITRENDDGISTMGFSLAGGVHVYRSDRGVTTVGPGDLFLNPRDGGEMQAGYISGLFCQIEHRRLQRSIRVIGRDDADPDLTRSWLFGSAPEGRPAQGLAPFLSFFSFVDQLLGEHPDLASGLGLDEQLYRLLAYQLLRANGATPGIGNSSSSGPSNWSSQLDELVDYIRAHAHLGLTLTDLEEQSHYSARHLQTLFREKFDCTPMQFVRRQRLDIAMQKLQTAESHETVTSISRHCGYRFLSNFTTDFQRQFGVSPSTVLRASRGNGGLKCT